MRWMIRDRGGSCLESLYNLLPCYNRFSLTFSNSLTEEMRTYIKDTKPNTDIFIDFINGNEISVCTNRDFDSRYTRALVINYLRRVRAVVESEELSQEAETNYMTLKRLTPESDLLIKSIGRNVCGDISYTQDLTWFLEQFATIGTVPHEEIKVKSAVLLANARIGLEGEYRDMMIYRKQIPPKVTLPCLLLIEENTDIPRLSDAWNFWAVTEKRLLNRVQCKITTTEGDTFYHHWSTIYKMERFMEGSYYEELQRRYNILVNRQILSFIANPMSTDALEKTRRLVKASLR